MSYVAKLGQKSKRARWKDRQERAYFAAQRERHDSLACMPERRARAASARITPRTGALLEEWRELTNAPAALARVLRWEATSPDAARIVTLVHPRPAMTLDVERYMRMVACTAYI